jgi:hypothetical protein
MPIPLGVLAVAGAGAAGAGAAYELLETTIVPSGGQASVTFSNLNSTYGSTYQHLQIRMTGATDRSGDWLDWLIVTLNSDTGSNYAMHRLFGENSVVTSSASTSQASIVRGFYVKGASGPASSFGAGVMDILDAFETTKYKTTRALTGYVDGSPSSEAIIALISGLWQNTNAITTIKLESGNSANLLEGSRFSLYGLRSA